MPPMWDKPKGNIRIKEHINNVKLDLSKHSVVSEHIKKTSITHLIGEKLKYWIPNTFIIRD